MDGVLEDQMESRFAFDFSRVRIHADSSAAESALDVNALAYTVANHVVFGAGKFSPWSSAGRSLIAHELAHVVQQREKIPSGPGALHISQDGPLERHANEAAATATVTTKSAAAGMAVPTLTTASGAMLQRAPQAGPLVLDLPRARLLARGNPDIAALVNALPARLFNGQSARILQVTTGGVTHVFNLSVLIKPGKRSLQDPALGETGERPSAPVGSSGAQTWNHDIHVELYQEQPDPVETLFHELVHARLIIDGYLPPSQQSATFHRFQKSLNIAKNTLLPARQPVFDAIGAIRKWYSVYVTGFKPPPGLDVASDDAIYERFINEKFAGQEANLSKSNTLIARLYASDLERRFARAADEQGLNAARVAADVQSRHSASLITSDDLVARLASALVALYTLMDTVGSAKEILPRMDEGAPVPMPDLIPSPRGRGP